MWVHYQLSSESFWWCVGFVEKANDKVDLFSTFFDQLYSEEDGKLR